MKNESTRIFHKRGNKYDEYYTTLEEVKYIFEEVIKEDFNDKIIYCPFDRDNSAFVKYISEHKEELRYKELWYTSDDFKNHEDLIEKCDVIISNPPFSLLVKEILPMFKKYNKEFFLFGSLMNCLLYNKIYNPLEIKYLRRGEFGFKSPYENFQNSNSDLIYVASTIYLTNFNIKETYKEYSPNNKFLSKSFNDIPHIYDKDGYLTIDKMIDFPNDYYEPIRCPITLLQYKYTQYFDYIYYTRNLSDGAPYNDGKSRFLRILIKRKNDKKYEIMICTKK